MNTTPSPESKIFTIFLADDHAMVREGLRLLIENEPDLKVTGEAGDGLEVLRCLEHNPPDILVTDVVMPGLDGLEVCLQVGRRFPQVRVVVLSMHGDATCVARALQNGAMGYVLKSSRMIDLIRAVREVLAGRKYLSSGLSDATREAVAYFQTMGQIHLDRYEGLTAREREVLQLASEGNTNKEIGARLFISPRTVESHRFNVMRKLRLRNHADLIRYVIQNGPTLMPATARVNREPAPAQNQAAPADSPPQYPANPPGTPPPSHPSAGPCGP
jgi:DNA-binding NarL/FixJ family response regulator